MKHRKVEIMQNANSKNSNIANPSYKRNKVSETKQLQFEYAILPALNKITEHRMFEIWQEHKQ